MITFDFETKSFADLAKVGCWAYSEHKTTDVICACWGIDNEPVQEWWPGKDGNNWMPADLAKAINSGHLIEAHYVAFERSIWMNVMARKYGWQIPGDAYWRDLMAVACYYALPASLDKLARVLNFEPKDPEGARLITKYSKLHLKTAKVIIPEGDFFKFVDYCAHDVRMEQSLSDHLGDLPERELLIWQLDQKINMRGMHLDQKGIAVAAAIVDQRSAVLTEEFVKLTGLNPTQRDKVIAWCEEQGVTLENYQAGYLQELVDGDLPQGNTRRAIEIRLRTNKASTKKLDAMSRQCGRDSRARFQTRYHGAGTGRNTGSGFQPLNLNRGFEDVDPKQLVRDVMHGDPIWLDMIYGDAMDAVAKASRHWITAEEGSKIVAGDFSSIEAIVLACLAGEQWKIDAFARGDKIYETMADKIHKLPPGTVTKATHPNERQDGKTLELACGYQGSLGAWLKKDSSGRHTDDEILKMVYAWRDEHPAIVQFWRDLDAAAQNALRLPGAVFWEGVIGFETVDEWLTMILPNGKRLWYYDPQLRAVMPPWHKPHENKKCAAGTCDCQPRTQVTYMAQKEGQWRRRHTYGGKWAENATQGTAREILEVAKQRVAELWYKLLLQSGYLRSGETCIVLSVYDEIVVEVPKNFGSVEEMVEISQQPIDWAPGWPIKMVGWEGLVYKK